VRNALLGLIAPLAVTLVACASAPHFHDEVLDDGPSYPDAVELLDIFAAHLPAKTDGVTVVDMGRLHAHHLPTAFGLLEKEWDSAPMTAEIKAVYVDHIGIDLTQSDTAFVAFHDDQVYLFILGDIEGPESEGTPRGELTVWKAPKEEGIVIARLEGLDAWILTHDDHIEKMLAGPRLAGTDQHKRLHRLLSRVGNADLVFAGSSSNLEDETVSTLPMPAGAEMMVKDTGAAVAVSDRFVLAILGKEETITELQSMVDEGFTELRQAIRDEKMPGGDGSTPMKSMGGSLGKIWAYHILGALQNEVAPAVEGDLIVWDLRTDFFSHPVTIGIIVGGIAYAIYSAFTGALGGPDPTAFTPTGPAPPVAPAPPMNVAPTPDTTP
jgi:hypothetical protein